MTQQPSDQKEVYFEEYCPKCKFKELPEESDKCDSCLSYPTNLYSHKPVHFEEEKK